MSGMEFNKIFAAVLVAGIIAMLSGFVAGLFVHEDELEKEAYPIAALESAAGGGTGTAAAPAGPEPILSLIAAADVAKGEKLSKACASCHNFTKGGPNLVGPNLWEVVGRAKAKHEGFTYSAGLGGLGGDWSYEDLNRFLWKPKALVPDTKMSFIGLKKAEDRAALIAWLRTLADSPHALPSDAEIAKEQADLGPKEPAEPVEAAAPEGEAAPAEEAPTEH